MYFYVCLMHWRAGCIQFKCDVAPGEQDVYIFTCAGAPGYRDVCIFACAGAAGHHFYMHFDMLRRP